MILFDLEKDVRKVMMPNTASNLKESKSNTLKDFVHVAGPLGVSHFVILSASENASYLRLAKSPRGPTVTMKIHAYSLMRDVLGAQQRPHCPSSMFHHQPLVVMNNFGAEEEMKLTATMFQNIFPAINVNKANLKACQRVLLLNRDAETGRISFRHYNITAQPSGVSKGIRNLVQRKELPDMGNMADVSDFVMKSGYGSESEGEEAGESRVTLAQDLGKGNLASKQSRVKLHEVGPRLELEVIKVEEGLCEGKVIFHKYVEKSNMEMSELDKAKKEKERLRSERRRQQEENVRRKKAEKEAKDAAKSAKDGGKKSLKRKQPEGAVEKGAKARRGDRNPQDQQDEDDDAEYYRKEVGEEPDESFQKPFKKGKGSRGPKNQKMNGGRSDKTDKSHTAAGIKKKRLLKGKPRK